MIKYIFTLLFNIKMKKYKQFEDVLSDITDNINDIETVDDEIVKNTDSEKDYIFEVNSVDLERLCKEYGDNALEILNKQIEYSNDINDVFRIIDSKSVNKLNAKKFTSIRKLNTVPLIHIDGNGFPHLTFGLILWKNRVYYEIDKKTYWKFIKHNQIIFYPDNYHESCFICYHNIPYTTSLSELNNVLENKDIKKILLYSEEIVNIMNDEKMNYEITGFMNGGKNFIGILVVCLIVGGLSGILFGFILAVTFI